MSVTIFHSYNMSPTVSPMNSRKAVEYLMPKIKNLIRTADIQSDSAYGILRRGFK